MIDYEIQSDWSAPFPFRMLRMESERDAELGQWTVQIAVLGFALILTWVFEDTKLRRELRETMDNDDWLAKSHVSMQFADYDELKKDARIGRAYLRWYGAAKGYRDVIADAAHAVILTDADKAGGA